MDISRYRPCVGIALFNRAGLVFAGRRANKALREHVAPGHEWQMPQGGIDPGEDPLKAAFRELREETNVTSATLIAEAPDVTFLIGHRGMARTPHLLATLQSIAAQTGVSVLKRG